MKVIEENPDWAKGLEESETLFLKMPLMHSEDLAVHELNVRLCPGDTHALGHKSVLERFGRFPKRNKALGRESTPEEVAYMASDEAQGRPY